MKIKMRDGMKIDDRGMTIDVRTEDCLYIEMGRWTFYIDNSTDEQIIEKWNNLCPLCELKSTAPKSIGDKVVEYKMGNKRICSDCGTR
tara:strand:+ start:463 stop:726 length:264 start_codon:yes stop_codon:yes gene_type:complete